MWRVVFSLLTETTVCVTLSMKTVVVPLMLSQTSADVNKKEERILEVAYGVRSET